MLKQDIVSNLIKSNKTNKEIVALLGCRSGYVSIIRKKFNLQSDIAYLNPINSNLFVQIQKRYELGDSIEVISKNFSISTAKIYRAIKNEKLKIKPRNRTDAGIVMVREGRYKPQIVSKWPTQQWYTTWNNKKYFLRSKSEVKYAQNLDKQQIDYEVETKRFMYLADDNKYRTYIADFYIPSRNLIVEIKGKYFTENNDKLKAQAVRSAGYEYKYILDGKDTII